jgi:hypothetical protein
MKTKRLLFAVAMIFLLNFSSCIVREGHDHHHGWHHHHDHDHDGR